MIPLRDTTPSRTFPYINILLIVINVAVFFHELILGRAAGQFIYTYGLVPRRFFYLAERGSSPATQYLPFFTSLFLHGGWLHIIGNMLFLWIFGDNVEDRMGHFKYLGFYLLCGLGAGFIHLYLNASSSAPAIGASGAISGIMGAYFLLFPRARILTLLPIFFFLTLVEVPAFFFIGIWFLLQLARGTFAIIGGYHGGVAWWAHVGGFLVGAGLVYLFANRRRRYRNYDWWR